MVLCNSTAFLKRELDLIFTKFKWNKYFIYKEDVIIYLQTVEENISRGDEIVPCLAEAGVAIKIKKRFFSQKKVRYLGHMIKLGELEIDRTNTESLRNIKPPTAV